jgi:hypothetical protein
VSCLSLFIGSQCTKLDIEIEARHLGCGRELPRHFHLLGLWSKVFLYPMGLSLNLDRSRSEMQLKRLQKCIRTELDDLIWRLGLF